LTGTGAASVFDTSYQFHPVYGVPYLPGTGLRGALRATMTKQFPLEAQALFGSSTEGREAAGYASVYDALWVPGSAQSPYAVDVLTVHHQDYYGAQDGQAVPAPTDFDQPNPVHFITAQGKMLFVLEAPNAEWLGFLRQVLEVTLHHSGTGAKKSSGYGRFALSGS
jgi:CRISPR-associated protein Cmr6